MVGEISWKAAAGEASFLTLDEEGMSKKWMKPFHDRTISLRREGKRTKQRGKEEMAFGRFSCVPAFAAGFRPIFGWRFYPSFGWMCWCRRTLGPQRESQNEGSATRLGDG